MKLTLCICVYLITGVNLFGQKCERYDKSLFLMLPKGFPDEINCIDTGGLKQGWWIWYKVEYNPVYIPALRSPTLRSL